MQGVRGIREGVFIASSGMAAAKVNFNSGVCGQWCQGMRCAQCQCGTAVGRGCSGGGEVCGGDAVTPSFEVLQWPLAFFIRLNCLIALHFIEQSPSQLVSLWLLAHTRLKD